jgi:hypothetical protein
MENTCGGILGQSPQVNYQVSVINCYNRGNMTGGSQSGGIAGSKFGGNTSNICTIRNCYNLGNNSNTLGGGIVGSDCGYTNNASYNPNILIENCYNLGSIYTNGGGIIGGTGSTSTNIPNITLKNCYNNGGATTGSAGIDSSDGLIADNFTYKSSVTVVNCYNAFNNSWTDSSANTLLTGVPGSNNLGITWTKAFTNKPWVLSSFNDALYNPNTGNVKGPTDSYTTTQGLIQGTDIQYSIVSNEVSVSNSSSTAITGTNGIISYSNINTTDLTTYTTNVITFKGNSSAWPIYSYQINRFVLYYSPPPTPIINESEMNTFMESTEVSEAVIIQDIELESPLIAEIPKILIANNQYINMTFN